MVRKEEDVISADKRDTLLVNVPMHRMEVILVPKESNTLETQVEEEEETVIEIMGDLHPIRLLPKEERRKKEVHPIHQSQKSIMERDQFPGPPLPPSPLLGAALRENQAVAEAKHPENEHLDMRGAGVHR